ncbi:MAG: tetratricopeptide repeat protein [Bdellovibrionaceae bacterium]|nr:tetratricopeptide repeat protein [Pseudobdellovibrionaceae bacterium]
MLKRNIGIIFLTLSILSCAHKEPKGTQKPSANSLVFLKQFNQASRHLDQLRYRKAIKVFKEILTSSVPIKFQSLVWYNLGWGYESLGKYKAANKCYRKSISKASKAYAKLKALSFVRLANTYKFLNQPNQELAALLDAYKVKKYLPYFVSKIQLPINLGVVYWVLGNHAVAKKFFLNVEKNILITKIKYRDPKKKINIIAKAFYLSSKLPRWAKKYKTIDRYVEELFVLQIYLLRATALNSPEWSVKASKELLNSYKLIFKVLKQQKTNKELAKYKVLKKNILYNLNKVLASSKDIKASQNLKSFQNIKSIPLKGLVKQLKKYQAYLQKKKH